MFRDLKEYQEIQKLYSQVSKPENLEERRGSNLSPEQIKKNQEGFKNRVLFGNPEGKKTVNTSQSNRNKLSQQRKERNKGRAEKQFGFLKTKPSSEFKGSRSRFDDKKTEKPMPTTAEIRAKSKTGMSNIPKKEGNAVIDGKKLNPNFGKKIEIKTDKFVEKNPPKEGSARAKMRAKNVERFGKERVQKLVQKNQEFQAAKKSGNLAQFKKDNPKMSGADRAKQMAKDRLAKKAAMEEYTPYDIVLEYLLSTEQVATIEEANYVMTEMDAETIQSIVSN